jgi:ferrous iron transport protein B
LKASVEKLEAQVLELYPSLPNARWVALRLLDGDDDIIRSLRSGELGNLIQMDDPTGEKPRVMAQEAA